MSDVAQKFRAVAPKFRQIAQELRNAPDHWTQHAFAKNAAGLMVAPEHPAATCWCALGLIRREFPTELSAGGHSSIPYQLLREAIDEIGGTDEENGIPEWNDMLGRTAAEVAGLFDLAANLAEGS